VEQRRGQVSRGLAFADTNYATVHLNVEKSCKYTV